MGEFHWNAIVHRRMESEKKKQNKKKKHFCFVGKLETVITRTWNILSTIVSLLVEITTAVAIKPDRGVNLQLGWITRERVNHWREMKFSNVIEIRIGARIAFRIKLIVSKFYHTSCRERHTFVDFENIFIPRGFLSQSEVEAGYCYLNWKRMIFVKNNRCL